MPATPSAPKSQQCAGHSDAAPQVAEAARDAGWLIDTITKSEMPCNLFYVGRLVGASTARGAGSAVRTAGARGALPAGLSQ